MVFLTCAGLAAGAITALGTLLPAYYCNLFAIMVRPPSGPRCRRRLASDLQRPRRALDRRHRGAGKLVSELLVKSLRLQFANLDLANDLLRQKELAETANIAKSRFLASASHDLRQPVHALGMFVGALGDRALDGDSRGW